MARGFFQSLFDFSFSSFITIRLIKVIYALFIAASAFFALILVAGAFSASAVLGLLALLIAAPVLFFFYVILARVYLELVVAIFRIAENTSILAGQGWSLSGPPPSLVDTTAPDSPSTAEVELPAEEPSPPVPPARSRPRRQEPLRPRRAAPVPPPEPPA